MLIESLGLVFSHHFGEVFGVCVPSGDFHFILFFLHLFRELCLMPILIVRVDHLSLASFFQVKMVPIQQVTLTRPDGQRVYGTAWILLSYMGVLCVCCELLPWLLLSVLGPSCFPILVRCRSLFQIGHEHVHVPSRKFCFYCERADTARILYMV